MENLELLIPIFIFSVLAMFGVGAIAIKIFLDNRSADAVAEKEKKIQNEIDYYKQDNARLHNQNMEMKDNQDKLLRAMFGNFTTMSVEENPINGKKIIFCTYNYSNPIKWEIKGVEGKPIGVVPYTNPNDFLGGNK